MSVWDWTACLPNTKSSSVHSRSCNIQNKPLLHVWNSPLLRVQRGEGSLEESSHRQGQARRGPTCLTGRTSNNSFVTPAAIEGNLLGANGKTKATDSQNISSFRCFSRSAALKLWEKTFEWWVQHGHGWVKRDTSQETQVCHLKGLHGAVNDYNQSKQI